MIRRGAFAPACLALFGLGAALSAALVEALGPEASMPAGATPIAIDIPSPSATSATEAADGTRLGALLARPLFDPRRRPVAPGNAPSAADLPRLTGVLVGAFGRRAIFAGPSGDQSLVVGEGDQIEAYLVQEIQPGAVVMTGPEGRRVLQPAFDLAGSMASPTR